MGPCLDATLIDRYLAGTCSNDERETVDAHVSACFACRDQIEQATRVFQTEVSSAEDVTRTCLEMADGSEPTQMIDDDRTRTVADGYTTQHTKPAEATASTTMFEGYEVTRELPRGGQAIVYLATHLATKTQVVIKVLLPTLLASARARYYFEREAELIASLDHPNIVGIHDSGIIHGQYYFVMHYISGGTLDQYVEDQELSIRERVQLFNKVCAAVSYAHQQGIIHRDLKFGNILVDSYGEPQILDFGLAKAIGADEQNKPEAAVTMTGQWAGTLSTMAPEQTLGKSGRIDVRADIYSLGVVLYRLLTGQYPYDASGSIVEVLQRIQEQEPVRPRQLVRQLDSDIEAILLCALAKDPEERYASAADFQRDLNNWLNGSPIQIKSVSTLYLIRKIMSKHRYVSMVVVLLLVIILSFVSISIRLLISTRKAEQKSQTIGDRYQAAAIDHSVFSNSIAFTYFLEFLHEGNTAMLNWAAEFLPQGSKERRAARFLLSSEPFAEKDLKYKKASTDDPAWFTSFIWGEFYRREGNHSEAIRAYQMSYRALRQTPTAAMTKSDQWLARNVAAHLYDLTGEHQWLERETVTGKNHSAENQ